MLPEVEDKLIASLRTKFGTRVRQYYLGCVWKKTEPSDTFPGRHLTTFSLGIIFILGRI